LIPTRVNIKMLLSKLKNLRRSWFEHMREFLLFGERRGGAFIGQDSIGNKYFEISDQRLMFPCKKAQHFIIHFITFIVRNRYVEYASGRGKDASQIPAEW
jgi:hypothetical protein